MELRILCSYCHLGSGLFPQVEAVILRVMWLEPVGFWVQYETLASIFILRENLRTRKHPIFQVSKKVMFLIPHHSECKQICNYTLCMEPCRGKINWYPSTQKP